MTLLLKRTRAITIIVLSWAVFFPAIGQIKSERESVRPMSEHEIKALRAKVQDSGTIRVIVGVQSDFQIENSIQSTPELSQADAIAQQRERIAVNLDALQEEMEGHYIERSVTKFETVPFMAMEVDEAGLEHSGPIRTSRRSGKMRSLYRF